MARKVYDHPTTQSEWEQYWIGCIAAWDRRVRIASFVVAACVGASIGLALAAYYLFAALFVIVGVAWFPARGIAVDGGNAARGYLAKTRKSNPERTQETR